jgi:hypothetical protein
VKSTTRIALSACTFQLSPSDAWLANLRLRMYGVLCLADGDTHRGHLMIPGERPLETPVEVVGAITDGPLVDILVLRIVRSGQVSTLTPRHLYVVYSLGDEGLVCTGVFESDHPSRQSFRELRPMLEELGSFEVV